MTVLQSAVRALYPNSSRTPGTTTVSAAPVSRTMFSRGPSPRGPQIRAGTMMRSAAGSKRVIFTGRRIEAPDRESAR